MKEHRIGFLILLFCLLVFALAGKFFPISTQTFLESLRDQPLLFSAIAYIVLYVVVTFFIWLSKDVFRFLAAVVFGVYLSTLLVWIAEVVNACILFGFSRRLGRAFVEDVLKTKYNRLDERLNKVNFWWLFLFRFVPLVPFRFLDLACGLTRISFRRYLAVAILGSPLRIFWVQLVLASTGLAWLKDPYALAEYFLGHPALLLFGLSYLLLVVVVALKLKET